MVSQTFPSDPPSSRPTKAQDCRLCGSAEPAADSFILDLKATSSAVGRVQAHTDGLVGGPPLGSALVLSWLSLGAFEEPMCFTTDPSQCITEQTDAQLNTEDKTTHNPLQ